MDVEEKKTEYLFAGESLRLYLARGLVAALEGMTEASLRKCNDPQEWVKHLAELQLPVIPKVIWDDLEVSVLEGCASVVVHWESWGQWQRDREMFSMQAVAPLPPGGIQGVCTPQGLLTLYMHGVQEFAAIKDAIDANLTEMRGMVEAFDPVFCEIVLDEVIARMTQHQKDDRICEEFVQFVRGAHGKVPKHIQWIAGDPLER